MSKKYDIAVVIGRFQPVHKGHIPTLERAAEVADNVVVVLGSDNDPRTIKNPFTTDERIEMLKLVVEDIAPDQFYFARVEDRMYQDHEWIRSVREAVVNSEPYYYLLQDELDPRVCIMGHEKDESSYYLHNFRPWKLEDTGAWVGFKHDSVVSATEIRNLWYSGQFGYATGNLDPRVASFIEQWTEDNEEEFLARKAEYDFIRKYKAATQVGPYPVQFQTTDAVVIQSGEILLIKRGEHPGKGQWALPGGFVNPNERIFDSCIRELLEETRIAVPEKVLRGSMVDEKLFDHPERSLRGRTVTQAYCFKLDPMERRPRVKGGDDAAEAYWFPLEQINRMRSKLFEDHADIINYFVSRN